METEVKEKRTIIYGAENAGLYLRTMKKRRVIDVTDLDTFNQKQISLAAFEKIDTISNEVDEVIGFIGTDKNGYHQAFAILQSGNTFSVHSLDMLCGSAITARTVTTGTFDGNVEAMIKQACDVTSLALQKMKHHVRNA